MKKFIYILLATAALCASSCISYPEQRAGSASIIQEALGHPDGFKCLSFEKTELVSAYEQAKERADYFYSCIDWDRTRVDAALKWLTECKKNKSDKMFVEQAQKDYDAALQAYNKNESVYNYLNELVKEYEGNAVSRLRTSPGMQHYLMTYSYKNPLLGTNTTGQAVIRFKDNKTPIAYKLGGEEGWNIIGDFFSIPGYYEHLN